MRIDSAKARLFVGRRPAYFGSPETSVASSGASKAIMLTAGSAGAATLNVAGGQLLGASGVVVGGNSYDVEFVDGTCIDLFNTLEDARLASFALFDQVLLDGTAGAFSSNPNLIQGCGGASPSKSAAGEKSPA
jgi:hypothetical protein